MFHDQVLTFYHCVFGDESVESSHLKHIAETLKAESSFQISKRPLNDWFGLLRNCSIELSKNGE